MSLSQKQFSDFKKVCEQFNQVEEVIEEELVHEICDELIEELIEEGYSEEEEPSSDGKMKVKVMKVDSGDMRGMMDEILGHGGPKVSM